MYFFAVVPPFGHHLESISIKPVLSSAETPVKFLSLLYDPYIFLNVSYLLLKESQERLIPVFSKNSLQIRSLPTSFGNFCLYLILANSISRSSKYIPICSSSHIICFCFYSYVKVIKILQLDIILNLTYQL